MDLNKLAELLRYDQYEEIDLSVLAGAIQFPELDTKLYSETQDMPAAIKR